MRSSSKGYVLNEKELFPCDGLPSTEEEYVNEMLPLYEETCSVKELSLSVTTFNVGCRKPGNITIPLMSLHNPATKESTDIIAIAFQEVDMSATALIREQTGAAGPWIAACNKMLNVEENRHSVSPNDYVELPPKQLVGLLLCVYIRGSLHPFLREYQVAVVPTGALGSVGNKGAVGVRLVIDHTSICFLSVHLPSGQSDVFKRNVSAETILTTMDFNAIDRAEYEHGRKSSFPGEALPIFPPIRLRDQDIVVVAGDLNYRVNLPYDTSHMLSLRKQYQALLVHDQLEAELKHTHTPWYGFTVVGPIAHPPTYRFDVGTNTYDTSEKRRIPGYTDRILIYVKDSSLAPLVKMDSLEAIMDVLLSDHKPVVSSLRIPVRFEEAFTRKGIEKELKHHWSHLSSSDALYRTETKISATALDFGDLYSYMGGHSKTITITNTGSIAASVRIVRVNSRNDMTLASWLRVTPASLVILPGHSKQFTVSTCIDDSSVPWLSEWKPFAGHSVRSLSSTLKVVVRSSACHFVACHATLLPSIVRNFLDSIYALGNTSLSEAYRLQKPSFEGIEDQAYPRVPKELWVMGEILSQHPHQPGLFTTAVDMELTAEVFRRLDSSASSLLEDSKFTEDPKLAVTVGHCLVTFLQQLILPVIPYERYGDVLNVMTGKGSSAAGGPFGSFPLGIIENISEVHANTFIYVLSLLQFFLRPENAVYNGLSSGIIAEVFSTVLLRPPKKGKTITPHFADDVPENALLPLEEVWTKPLNQKDREQMEEEQELAKHFIEFFLVGPSPAL